MLDRLRKINKNINKDEYSDETNCLKCSEKFNNCIYCDINNCIVIKITQYIFQKCSKNFKYSLYHKNCSSNCNGENLSSDNKYCVSKCNSS